MGSGEGNLRELERILDDAVARYKSYCDKGYSTQATAYRHGIAAGICDCIALIGNTEPSQEWEESELRLRRRSK